MPIKYDLPDFLHASAISRQTYARWLTRKASSLVRRDRKRWGTAVSQSDYKRRIHAAVKASEGRDFYTEEDLDWELISQYDNKESQQRRVDYKKEFARLPTVDHVDPGSKEAEFKICSWRTNDCKNDLTVKELREFCETFLQAQERHAGSK